MNPKLKKVEIYIDGGVRGNQKKENIGAWAAVLKYGPYIKEIYDVVRNTTNNRMELTAAIMALKQMKRFDIPVEVYTDSAYLYNCINQKWYKKWEDNGWMTSKNEPVENRDLWIQLLDLIEQFKFISFFKVKGHSNNEGNNRADELVNYAMDKFQ
jgi:ribonuclease HI